MNRPTYLTIFALIVVMYGALVAFMEKPPGIGEVIMISLGVPRLHDLGRSGWWIAVPIVLELVAIVCSVIFLPMGDLLIVAGLVVLLMAVMMLVLGLIPGQPGANAYGEAPPPGMAFWRGSRPA